MLYCGSDIYEFIFPAVSAVHFSRKISHANSRSQLTGWSFRMIDTLRADYPAPESHWRGILPLSPGRDGAGTVEDY